MRIANIVILATIVAMSAACSPSAEAPTEPAVGAAVTDESVPQHTPAPSPELATPDVPAADAENAQLPSVNAPVVTDVEVDEPVDTPETVDDNVSTQEPVTEAAITTHPGQPAAAPFSFSTVVNKARKWAAQPYEAPPPVPNAAGELDYNAYRRIEFLQSGADFADDTKSDFRVLYDPAGFLFKSAVQINLIENGIATPRQYDASQFNFFDLGLSDDDKANLGYAGFRIVAPLNKAGKFDEVASFKGASFFRVLGTATAYGTSSRGLSIATGSPKGEEFPEFREFWIEHGANQSLIVYALLDSPSVTGAYQFTIMPGNDTRVEVKSVLVPRKELTSFGIAPLTSMFDLGPHDPAPERRDYRPRVHDAEGLSARLSNGEWIWRPLSNPSNLEISGFSAETPMGFGLTQRTRDFDSYNDLEARYHARPSVWVEPLGDWGKGALTLVEIPTNNEFNDNIVAFFKPDQPLRPGEEQAFSYRMSWGLGAEPHTSVARAAATRTGLTPNSRNRVFLIDFESENPELLEDVQPVVAASAGEVSNIVLTPNPHTSGVRLSFELQPQGETLIELRASLTRAKRTTSETWLYRWTP